MRNDDRPADDEADGQSLCDLGVGEPLLGAADEVVGDAVVAAEYEGGDEAEQLLRRCRQGTVLVDAGVEGEEAADVEVVRLEDAVVHAFAECAVFLQAHCDSAASSAAATWGGAPSLSR